MDWTPLANGLDRRELSALNQSNDPRVGSSRDNSTTGTLSHVTSSGTNSSSASSLGSTFVPVLIYSGVCLAIFIIFRRRCQRVYAPRTFASIRRSPLQPVPPLPGTWFSWVKDFYKIDERFLLNNTSLDGFLFLRYVRVLATICFAGCAISWPVLLSVNATGGNNLTQLELLTIGDVARPVKFYAHVLIAWLFFGFILFMICRECIYYINLRQAYLTTPQQAHKLSARTVLFTCVPKRFLDEHRVRKLFGDSVKNVWVPRNTRALQRLVEERENAAVRLEKAEIELIRKANMARQRMLYGAAATARGPAQLPHMLRLANLRNLRHRSLPVAEASAPGGPPTRIHTASSLATSQSSSAHSYSSSSSSSPPSTPSKPPSSSVSLRSSASTSVGTTASPAAQRTSANLPGSPPLAPAPSAATPTPPRPSFPAVFSLSRRRSAPATATCELPASPPSPAAARTGAATATSSAARAPIHEITEANEPSAPNPSGQPPEQSRQSEICEPAQAVVKTSACCEIDEVSPADRQGSFSDAGSGPSSATAVPSPNPMSDALVMGVDPDGRPMDSNKALRTAIAAKDGEDGAEDDDVEDESLYVHPYGFAPTLPDVRGSVAAQWLPADKRPSHRPLANFGRQVDTIRWTRMRIKALNASIAKMRRRFRRGDGSTLSSMFVEFDTQAAAQVAFQVLSHHQPLHMFPRYIGIRPEDIIWSSLRIRWWERIIRRFFVMGAIAAGIVFWSIPAAFVGLVSNISFLSSKVFFLHWISSLPNAITGVIEGLLPAVALSLLMAAVPGMLRACGRAAGIPSAPMVELFTQNAYFCFQVVQVFLITTLTSAASAAFTKILEDPLSAKDLLSQNLPKASNFYLSYITVQCLAGGAISLVHTFDLFRHTLLAKSIQHPRRAVRVFQRLKQPHWGGVFPVFTNMGVIAISYTCIAPLILAFAGAGMLVTYQVYKYNLLYTFDTDRDSKGLHYPRALMHLMIGLYLAQICLIGLFSLQSAIGPVVMMIMFLVFTFLVHVSLNDAVTPLLYNLPRTLALEDKDLAIGHQDLLAEQEAAEQAAAAAAANGDSGAGLNADYYDMEEGFGNEHDSDDDLHQGPMTTRGIDGVGDLMGLVKDWGRDAIKDKMKSEVKAIKKDVSSFKVSTLLPWWKKPTATAGNGAAADGERSLGPDGLPLRRKPNFFVRWLHPEIYEDYTFLRKMLSADAPPIEYPPDYARRGYLPPEMWKPIPKLWIPRDDAGVSRQEVAHSRKVLPATDRGAWLTAKGNVVADLDKAPFLEPIYLY